MEIRCMTQRDIARIAELEQLCFSEPWSEKQLTELLTMPEYLYLVAVENEAVLGYAGMVQVGEEGQITNIATAPEARRRGVARALLEEVLSVGAARNVQAFSLEVRDSNTAAIALYEQTGFCLAGVRKNFYRKPTEDGRIYWYPKLP